MASALQQAVVAMEACDTVWGSVKGVICSDGYIGCGVERGMQRSVSPSFIITLMRSRHILLYKQNMSVVMIRQHGCGVRSVEAAACSTILAEACKQRHDW